MIIENGRHAIKHNPICYNAYLIEINHLILRSSKCTVMVLRILMMRRSGQPFHFMLSVERKSYLDFDRNNSHYKWLR